MAARVVTLAFQGVEAQRVDVEVRFSGGLVNFIVVGLGDKAVGESRERVRAAFSGLGLQLPSKRIIVNLRRPTCPRRAATTICPSRSPSWRPWGSSRPTG